MNLILGMTGASGALAADLVVQKSPWPVALVASDWGKDVYERECGPFDALKKRVAVAYDNTDLAAAIASGAEPTAGMVLAPCSVNALGQIANGIADTLVTRAAHCHLKERRPLVLCVREAPWTLIALENAKRVAAAGGTIMPISPPFYAFAGTPAREVGLDRLMAAYVDRVLSLIKGPSGESDQGGGGGV